MEKPRTQADVRREKFAETARMAKELGDKALSSIDAVLREEEELMSALQVGVDYGNITPEERDECFLAWKTTRLQRELQAGQCQE
jgi:hypothetical protein